MVTHNIFLFDINCKHQKCAWRFKNLEIIKCFAKVELLERALSLRLLRIDFFSFAIIIAHLKIIRVTINQTLIKAEVKKL